ncbi:MAG: hypothetical protein AB1916_04730 [Thermodesulfobacteriota bacterium]
MPKSDLEIRAFAHRAVMRRLACDQGSRAHALREYMSVSMPNVDEDEAQRLADMAPPLLGELYARWADMFVDRLLETVEREALEALCSGRVEDEAALALAFIMFLESERMEAQVQEDLERYGRERSLDRDAGAVAAAFLRSRIQDLARRQEPEQ